MNLSNAQADVARFTKEIKHLDLPDRPDPEIFENHSRALRQYLVDHIKEEVRELEEHFIAPSTDDTEAFLAVADDFVDIIYVTLQAANHVGLNLQPFWDEVQAANMRKEGGAIVDGHLQKPEGWVPADLERVLSDQIRGVQRFAPYYGMRTLAALDVICPTCGNYALRVRTTGGPAFCATASCEDYLVVLPNAGSVV